jgi:hypothetical protein
LGLKLSLNKKIMAEKTKKETNDRNYSCGQFAGGYDVLEDDALKKSIEKLKERKEQEPNKKK